MHSVPVVMSSTKTAKESMISTIVSRPSIGMTASQVDKHLKFLECCVCWELSIPPLKFCVQGHCICRSCKLKMMPPKVCPVCREKFSTMRNLFAENFLEDCEFLCRYGCSNKTMTMRQLINHEENVCKLRSVSCTACLEDVEFGEFLDHLKTNGIERLYTSECINLFSTASTGDSKHTHPFWLNCFGFNFFINLAHIANDWFLWVYAFEENACTNYECMLNVSDKKKANNYCFKGKIHPLRSKIETVCLSKECLMFSDTVMWDVVINGEIETYIKIKSVN